MELSTKEGLRRWLECEKVNPILYSLEGGSGPDTVIIDHSSRSGLWFVYYSERGSRSEEMSFSIESDACSYFVALLRRSLGPRFPGEP